MTDPTDETNVKARALHWAARRGPLVGLLADPNINGLGYGRREVAGRRTEEPAVVVYVARKVPAQFLPGSRLLPRRLSFGSDAVEVDVVETGPFFAQRFTGRERPAPAGVSVGHVDITAGTLGSLVVDSADGTWCLLSNNHVLANVDAGRVGDTIVQPGPYDGGSAPADAVATLRRFVPLGAAGNTVDGALGTVLSRDDVVDRVKDDLMPVATAAHPAVGLLFAGSYNRTLLNPIDEVLRLLGVTLPGGGGVTAGAEIGSAVEKVGRTTGYTTATVTETDVTVNVDYGPGHGVLGFEGQIATGYLSEGGDSGSLVYLCGTGGAGSRCD
ncbi:hypothetical protein [Micromonospora sp. RTGN7]|uniref:hypothetical protein n=1 Tax=Micromonospora sp. RTGN7 TaxID=3016526 RepID=UPI0029FEE5E6|nr:hypothetical protein [Micromonospora sp. RTGN7]